MGIDRVVGSRCMSRSRASKAIALCNASLTILDAELGRLNSDCSEMVEGLEGSLFSGIRDTIEATEGRRSG